MNKNQEILLEVARKNKRKIAFWNFLQPNTDRSYEDLIESIKSGDLTLNKVSTNEWESFKKKNMGEYYNPDVAGYMTGDRKSINIPDNAPDTTLMHEMLHFFTSHGNIDSPKRPGGYGTSKYNTLAERYRRLDRDKAKGWLPSLHPFAPRPELPGDNLLSKNWNKYLASSKSATELDREMNYGTLSGAKVFDVFSGEFGNDYGSHYHGSSVPKTQTTSTLSDFGSAFKKARESGSQEFDYKGKKYHTKSKEELESQNTKSNVTLVENPKPIDFLSRLKYNMEESKTDATRVNNRGVFR